MSSHDDPGVAGLPEENPATGTAAPPSGQRGTPESAQTPSTGRQAGASDRPGNMLPGRSRRRFGVERLLVRLVATCGIIAIGVALGAILVSSKVQGWITGLVVAVVSVVLAAMLWSSRQL
jgi:hypothetical protein